MKSLRSAAVCFSIFFLVTVARSQDSAIVAPIDYELTGPLIPAHTTIVTAWDIPRNPLTDTSLDHSPEGAQIRQGFQLFMNTPLLASRFVRNGLTCNNCHLNAGQRDRAMALVGVASVFPEYNKRAGISFTLEDRIVGCFLRSENATANADAGLESGPSPESEEVLAISAYLTWLSEGYAPGHHLPWRKQNTIEEANLIPPENLDPARGEKLFREHCVNCHGDDGQGVQIGDKKAGPLWGPASWNDGAGAARIYTLAGIIRYMMPYLEPGKLTDEEAQHISAFINSKSRPEYPDKEKDYLLEPIPVDAVYYRPYPAKQ